MRNRRLQRIEVVIERQQRVPVKPTMIASSAVASTLDFGVCGPVGRSATEPRFFHLATVF